MYVSHLLRTVPRGPRREGSGGRRSTTKKGTPEPSTRTRGPPGKGPGRKGPYRCAHAGRGRGLGGVAPTQSDRLPGALGSRPRGLGRTSRLPVEATRTFRRTAETDGPAGSPRSTRRTGRRCRIPLPTFAAGGGHDVFTTSKGAGPPWFRKSSRPLSLPRHAPPGPPEGALLPTQRAAAGVGPGLRTRAAQGPRRHVVQRQRGQKVSLLNGTLRS